MMSSEEKKLRLAYIAGFVNRGRFQINPEDLQTMYGLDIEAEQIHMGFEQFLSDLPNLLEMLHVYDEDDAPVQIELDLDIHP